MDKKAFLAVGLSLAIWVAWQKIYLEPIQQRAALEEQYRKEELAKKEQAASSPVESSISPTSVAKKDAKPLPVQAQVAEGKLQNGNAAIGVSNHPYALSSWELKSFSTSLSEKAQKINLAEATGFGNQLRVRFSDPALSLPLEQTWQSFELQGSSSAISRTEGPGVEAKRVFTLDEHGYGGKLEYTFRFSGEAPKFVFVDIYGSPNRPGDKEGSIFGQAPDKVRITHRNLNGYHAEIAAAIKENQEAAAGVRWIGLDTRYFVLALVPVIAGDVDIGSQIAHAELGAPAIRGSLVFPTGGKKEITLGAKVYFGPKDMELLTKVDPVLADAVDFGWTSAIAIPLLQALKWLYSYLKNYGLAIIALTFLIKMLLFPLMYKSMVSMAKMAKLQPQLNALREKYKDDKEKLNVEMMSFMKQNGYNPIGGCLPILLQMPIFFALYRVLFNSMELYQAPFLGWIHDLSSPDPFFVTPVLLTGLMYLQQKLSPNTAADPAQQKMLQIMPVMFGAFMLMLPSGLTIYMVVNSATSIAQQWFLNRKLGIKPGVAVAKA